jgi:hypothetical protein
MLIAILSVPRSEAEWATWSWHHRLSHDAIRQAIQAQKNINLVDYQVDPIAPQDITGFLQRDSQLHIEMTAAVGIASHDLQDVDFKDQNQLESWINVHWSEHRDTEDLLGLGS